MALQQHRQIPIAALGADDQVDVKSWSQRRSRARENSCSAEKRGKVYIGR